MMAPLTALVCVLLATNLVSSVVIHPDLTSHGLFARAGSTCPSGGQQSCHNTTRVTDTCCFETPGGLLLQTQFWDTDPSTGPSDSWTIHGLWPDNCDTTFTENCDPSRAYTDIAGILTDAGATETLSFMQTFWKDINGNDETFWEHEWSTHGTCYSTLNPSCLPSGSPPKTEAVDFFNRVVELFKTLPTFTFLSSQGITPTNSKTFTLSQLTSALKAESGFTPALGCSGSTLNTIAWYFNLKGSLIDGQFVAIDSPLSSTCPSSGIKYVPKSGSSTSTSSSTGSGPTGSPGSLPPKSTLSGSKSGSKVGGLLTSGTLSVQTPATYTLSGTTSSFSMTTSKGKCAVSSGALTCGSGVSSSSTFSTVSSGSQMLIAFDGATAFSTDGAPTGTAQETIFTGTGHSETFSIVIDAGVV